jgi:hypothetical protein
MERINIFKIKKNFIQAFIGFGIIFIMLGLTLLLRALTVGFDYNFFGGDWNSILYIVQGIVFVLLGLYQLKYRNYFIEWDETEIRYFIKGEKKIRRIEISKIKSIEIKTNMIVIQINEYEEKFQLVFELVEFNTLTRIKMKFEELKSKL